MSTSSASYRRPVSDSLHASGDPHAHFGSNHTRSWDAAGGYRRSSHASLASAMVSVALRTWRTRAGTELDEIEAAHAAVGGTGRGRRYATLQLNHAYTMLLSSQFQRFCRDLHSEAASFLAQNGARGAFQSVALTALTQGRKLDIGNPNEGNIGADFARLGMTNLWDDVNAADSRNQGRRKKLRTLNEWRNAIAHQDFSKVGATTALVLKTVQSWRAACDGLAASFDALVGDYAYQVVAQRPW